MRIRLIINPISGTKSKKKLPQKLERRLKSFGHTVETSVTEHPGHATDLAHDAAEKGFEAVLVCGGDGTVNEAAKGLIGSNTVLGILPNGSGNGLARHIDVPVDPLLALNVIKDGHITDCDYCTVNGVPFFCTFGLGFDAAVTKRFTNSGKRGLMSYLKSTFDEFVKFTPDRYTIQTPEQTLDIDAFLIACCNASQYGNNAFIAPTASITDGKLDVTVVHSGNPLSQALVGVELLAGSIAKGGLIDTFRATQLMVHRKSPGIAHIDGEPIELEADLNIKCHHGGLKIFSKKRKTRFIPLVTPSLMFFRDCTIRVSNLLKKN